MFELHIEGETFWNSEIQQFYDVKEKTFHFEHSLASISKWEQKWHIPYLQENDKTEEQARDYIRCMCFEEIDELYLSIIVAKYLNELNDYIKDPATATWFKEDNNQSHNRNNIITNEVIYHMMTVHNIPFECENWHFNRLMTLIRVCNEKNGEQKHMSKRETLEYQAQLNAARRAKKGLK